MIRHYKFLVGTCLIIAAAMAFSKKSYAQTVVNPDSALQIILNTLEGTSISLSQAQEYAKKIHLVKAVGSCLFGFIGNFTQREGRV